MFEMVDPMVEDVQLDLGKDVNRLVERGLMYLCPNGFDLNAFNRHGRGILCNTLPSSSPWPVAAEQIVVR